MAYQLKRKESVEQGVQRIAREQLGKAIQELQDDELDRHETVHQVRKRFKKIRGLIRLVRPGFDGQYSELNRWYRDAGRRLTRVRDAESMLEALRRLRSRFDEPLAATAFANVEARLKECRRKIANESIDLDEVLVELCEELQVARHVAGEWALSGDDRAVVSGGFTKTYRRGFRARAEADGKRNDELLHEWRKRMKYHWYHSRLLRNVWKPVVKARTDELDELSDLLGDDHDLAVFTRVIKDDPKSFGPDQTVELLMGVIGSRRKQLQKAAFRLGDRLCAEKPKALRKRFERYWKIWKD